MTPDMIENIKLSYTMALMATFPYADEKSMPIFVSDCGWSVPVGAKLHHWTTEDVLDETEYILNKLDIRQKRISDRKKLPAAFAMAFMINNEILGGSEDSPTLEYLGAGVYGDETWVAYADGEAMTGATSQFEFLIHSVMDRFEKGLKA